MAARWWSIPQAAFVQRPSTGSNRRPMCRIGLATAREAGPGRWKEPGLVPHNLGLGGRVVSLIKRREPTLAKILHELTIETIFFTHGSKIHPGMKHLQPTVSASVF